MTERVTAKGAGATIPADRGALKTEADKGAATRGAARGAASGVAMAAPLITPAWAVATAQATKRAMI